MALSYASVDLCLVVVILALNIVPGSRALNAEDFNTSSATTWSNQEITFNAIYGLLNSTNYSNHVLPHHASHAAALATNAITQITPKAFILRVGDISMDNVFNVDFYFTQLWVDPRLDGLLHNVSKFRLRQEMINKLWLPDTIIRNSQESTYPDYSKQDNDEVVILRPGGVIEYTSRNSEFTTWLKSDEEATFTAIFEVLNSSNYSNNMSPHIASRKGAITSNDITTITPKVYILRVGDITMQNDFSVDFYFTQRWVDPRLDGVLHNMPKFRLKNRKMIEEVWLPDTIIRNSQASRYPDYSRQDIDQVVVLRPGGEVKYTSRVSSACFCSLDLHWYPFDEQHCKVEFEFMSYDVNELVYSEPKYFQCVSLAPGATLPTQYILLNDTIKKCTVHNLTYVRGEIGGHGIAIVSWS
ncbi:gamma-aminobutyric acid receptor subunit beta-like isoform X3 [Corticium candelabrum]|uniref:gamma-aminobutyric acid receptor subunit beta-like isoform X3 n=1 Tax=Corticium candelabrum TaxID=121492 RepID=UPI002E2636EA|nr:gamma-aminobutyric acid receptor subunit beta-like isoform X3 [Corticium candelabrum]